MKKKILSIALTVMMTIGLAAGFNNPIHAEDEVTLIVNSSTADDTAERANNAAYKTIAGALAKAQNGDTIQLGSDITENITIAQDKEVVLDLNGHVLNGDNSSSNTGRVIDNEGTLTIIDSTNTTIHYFKVSNNGLWQLQSAFTGTADYTFDATNGLKKSGIASDDMPATDSIIAVSGGVITGGYKTGVDTGAGIENRGGTLNINGGNIVGNYAEGNGAGVRNGMNSSKQGSFKMTGGSVIGNVCGYKENSVTSHGAGGGVSNEGSDFVMTGGTISYNYAGTMLGGGVENNGSMTVGGVAVIKCNKSISNNASNNLYVYTSKLLTVSNDGLNSDAEIWVTLESTTGAVTNASSTDWKDYFHSDNTDYVVYNNGKENNQQVYIGNPVAEIAETEVKYDTVQNAVNATAGTNKTVKLLTDVVLSNTLEVSGNENCTDIVLDLNGYVLASDPNDPSVLIRVSQNLCIKDSNSDSTHTGSYASLPNGGLITGGTMGIYVSAGTLTMIGGTITGNACCGVDNAASFVMTGGAITGNTGESFIGGVLNEYAFWDPASVQMIVGGTAVINNNKMTDGTDCNLYLQYDTETGAHATITIGTKTSAAEGNGVSAPAKGMKIGVTHGNTTGKFTTNGVETDKKYFTSDNTAYVVKYNENQYLEIGEQTVCKIGITEYKTIAQALATITDDTSTVITMIDDCKENVTIDSGRNITLDLNSKIITGKFTDYGNLTVKDSSENKTGKIYKEETGNYWVQAIKLVGSEATFTLENGTLETKAIGSGATAVTVENDATKGTININGGSVIATSATEGKAYAVLDQWGSGATYTTAVNVTGGSFTGALLLQNGDEGDLFNYVGHDETLIKTMLNANGKIKITLDGDVELDNALTVNSGKNVTLDLNGHTITAASTKTAVINNGTLTLTDTSGSGGGKITGGAKGVEQNGTLTLAGNASITDNTVNLYLPENKVVTVESGFSGEVGITLSKNVGVFTGAVAEATKDHFVSDNENCTVIHNSNNCLELVYTDATITVKDQNGTTVKTITGNKVNDKITLPTELKTGYSFESYSYGQSSYNPGAELTIPEKNTELSVELSIVIKKQPTAEEPTVETDAQNVSYQWYTCKDAEAPVTFTCGQTGGLGYGAINADMEVGDTIHLTFSNPAPNPISFVGIDETKITWNADRTKCDIVASSQFVALFAAEEFAVSATVDTVSLTTIVGETSATLSDTAPTKTYLCRITGADGITGDSKTFTVKAPELIHNEKEDVNVDSETGKGYKEFVVGNASASTVHIDGAKLKDVYKDSVTGKYTGILVKNGDDTLIEETDYTVSEGSVKVELTKEYLNKLAVGTYTVKVYLNMDGAATTDSNYYEGTINVKVKPAESGNTDSGSTYTVVNTSVTGTENNAVSRALGLIAMVTVAGAVMLKKKENY